jgi:hypothetical protein
MRTRSSTRASTSQGAGADHDASKPHGEARRSRQNGKRLGATGFAALSFALSLLVAPVVALAQAPSPAPGAARLSWSGASLTVASEGTKPARLPLALDKTVATPARVLETRIVGEPAPGVFVVVDAFASKPEGLSRCKAGRERFLRLVRAMPGAARELATVKLESCLDDLEMAPDGLRYDEAAATLSVDWVGGPAAATPSQLIWRLRGAVAAPK